jgi:hypothetical protein
MLPILGLCSSRHGDERDTEREYCFHDFKLRKTYTHRAVFLIFQQYAQGL